jgi:excisionase family DNA binding protein
MVTTISEREPVLAPEGERSVLSKIERLLRAEPPPAAVLVGPDGDEVALPESALRLLRQSVPLLARGQVITLLPQDTELTTQGAADLLNVSRTYLVRLLEAGELPFTLVGTHRRIRFEDVIEYKRRRDAKRRAALDDLMRMSLEAGLYSEAETETP